MSYSEANIDEINLDKDFIAFIKYYQKEYRSKILLDEINSDVNNSYNDNNKDKGRLGKLFTKEKLKVMLVKFFTTEYYDSDEK